MATYKHCVTVLKKVPLKIVGLGAVCERKCDSQVIPFARFL